MMPILNPDWPDNPRCIECQTYGSEDNPLVYQGTDDMEDEYLCESCCDLDFDLASEGDPYANVPPLFDLGGE